MLLDEAPFEVVSTVNEQPVKKKLAKETKVKNITFIPVPDSGKTCVRQMVICVPLHTYTAEISIYSTAFVKHLSSSTSILLLESCRGTWAELGA